MTEQRRVAITGLGVKAPGGTKVNELFDSVLAGRSMARTVPELAERNCITQFACKIDGFEPEAYFTARELRQLDFSTRIGVAAAADAIEDAGWDGADSERAGGYVGTGGSTIAALETLILQYADKPDKVPIQSVPMLMSSSIAARMGIRFKLRGPCHTLATACASGATAIGEALLAIRRGVVDTALAGGVEAPITMLVMSAFARSGAMSQRNDDPTGACRPFDATRDGFVMGEGAAFLVLEEWSRAEARGARIYGELAGYAANSDALHIVAPDEEARGAEACMRAAIADAGLTPSGIGHVNSHGTSTQANDRAEALAISRVFGDHRPPVTATKGVTGHLIGGAGALEAVIATLSARTGLIPPIANYTSGPEAELVDLVAGSPRQTAPAPVISNSFGFGGHNVSLVITPAP
ncbi:beta-ketoacyl-[acyl-carrier-protein] synthase family protein [Bailinhaonella thermotolerans]|uniref:Beta-ketoacyl-[acyl-carrier-protein] synthase family protein n=1 Tax=Bailinhaonella thermotolerans TaxID=1070861 RepID=A0A3A4A0L1_9ACTN|nr:beta-ketoacyl-[acyl-carrier-protein] synthase family protein [Bailinhaonella thermotolerans]RJL20548.1 beta-ketoacyl-[acyl-carrier-protein] synthase family protein [Bailinhaonella thermotolerans]